MRRQGFAPICFLALLKAWICCGENSESSAFCIHPEFPCRLSPIALSCTSCAQSSSYLVSFIFSLKLAIHPAIPCMPCVASGRAQRSPAVNMDASAMRRDIPRFVCLSRCIDERHPAPLFKNRDLAHTRILPSLPTHWVTLRKTHWITLWVTHFLQRF